MHLRVNENKAKLKISDLVPSEPFLNYIDVQKTKIMASGPITSREIDGETVETVSDFILGGLQKSLQMVIAAMKLKDAYSLEETL